ncbi:chromate transporter [Alkaliphilus sp. MSJ-5]|uniref:Chromate transporter n=1 Tax=Alkaliphilus flagellatus TaxID=2841507 RepID=A0ABS6G1U5_9FIRM|nr:chromate transporter [Alkaliphilus flagellatus]MBU5676450.1 chromate transporter [Alkaliphilus flagellatus]
MIYLKLFLEFFKIGLFAVGGGLATLPFLQQLIDKYGWITHEQLLDMIAISESTPGPIGVNTATFVGNTTAGVLGGIVATIGIVTPSVIIILLIAHYFAKFSEKPIVKSSFYGIRPAVTGLIAAVAFEVAKIALFDIEKYKTTNKILSILDLKAIVLFSIMLYLINKYKKHPILYLVGAAFIGIIFKY